MTSNSVLELDIQPAAKNQRHEAYYSEFHLEKEATLFFSLTNETNLFAHSVKWRADWINPTSHEIRISSFSIPSEPSDTG